MADITTVFKARLNEHAALLDLMGQLENDTAAAARIIANALQREGRLLLCGNGGSAADAQHIAAEFSGRFLKERRPYDAIALHTNTSSMTAIGNDYGFDLVFSRLVRAHGRAGDVLLGISTSGNSPNIIEAFKAAREKGMTVIAMTGKGGGKLGPLSDICLAIPSKFTPLIQEMHIFIGHIICQIAEELLCLNRQ